MLGTAPEASAFLLVEVRGSWASKILASELPEAVRACLATVEASHPGLRLQFIRAPRRTRGSIAVYLCRVGHFVSCLPLERLEDVPSVDVGSWLTHGALPSATLEGRPLTLVCTHGRRDVCCALQGNPCSMRWRPRAARTPPRSSLSSGRRATWGDTGSRR
ncbi:MAG: hypothetical protein IPG17_31525 [Sandaracinaceae bacterium]|nr:hypothetical protein [Sandaracinaceae bacterium]